MLDGHLSPHSLSLLFLTLPAFSDYGYATSVVMHLIITAEGGGGDHCYWALHAITRRTADTTNSICRPRQKSPSTTCWAPRASRRKVSILFPPSLLDVSHSLQFRLSIIYPTVVTPSHMTLILIIALDGKTRSDRAFRRWPASPPL